MRINKVVKASRYLPQSGYDAWQRVIDQCFKPYQLLTSSCKHMDHNSHAVNVFNTLAEVYQDKYMSVDRYHEMVDSFCSKLPLSGKVLDVACGPGNILKYIHDHHKGKWVLEGLDLAKSMIELAKVNVPSASFRIADCRELSNEKSKYNGIICSFCAPYLNKSEIRQLIVDISSLLKGVLLFSFISGVYEESGYVASSSGDQVWNHYYKKESIIEWLKESGFKIDDIQSYSSPNPNQGQTDVMLIASNI